MCGNPNLIEQEKLNLQKIKADEMKMYLDKQQRINKHHEKRDKN